MGQTLAMRLISGLMKEVVNLSEKKYIITTPTELVTEELKDQAIGLRGTSSTQTLQRIQIFKEKKRRKKKKKTTIILFKFYNICIF